MKSYINTQKNPDSQNPGKPNFLLDEKIKTKVSQIEQSPHNHQAPQITPDHTPMLTIGITKNRGNAEAN
jgi:hypothetical protein